MSMDTDHLRIMLEIPDSNQGRATLGFNGKEELTDRSDTIFRGLIV